jgi:hypothetical protein
MTLLRMLGLAPICVVHRNSYNAALSQSVSDIQQCPDMRQLTEFRNVVLNSFGLTPQPRTVRHLFDVNASIRVVHEPDLPTMACPFRAGARCCSRCVRMTPPKVVSPSCLFGVRTTSAARGTVETWRRGCSMRMRSPRGCTHGQPTDKVRDRRMSCAHASACLSCHYFGTNSMCARLAVVPRCHGGGRMAGEDDHDRAAAARAKVMHHDRRPWVRLPLLPLH